MSIQGFVQELRCRPSSDVAQNPYSEETLANNLTIYLERMLTLNPTILLVGEAPGHKGCAKTGIPFTDEAHMMTLREHRVLGGRYGYRCSKQQSMLERENSATIIWNVLDRIETIPLMWNIFPFHPHETSELNSNRRPSAEETETGLKFLMQLLSIFSSVDRIYAVGRVAEKRLNKATDRHGMSLKNIYGIEYIRHPSHGGKEGCECRLCDILSIY